MGSNQSQQADSSQTYAVVDKIIEVDRLLQTLPEFCIIVREVHPAVYFSHLAGRSTHSKGKLVGREERSAAVGRVFPRLDGIVKARRASGLLTEDVRDAAVACWPALCPAAGRGWCVPAEVPSDATKLPMAIWA